MSQPPRTPVEARDTVLRYYRATLNALPDGYIIDGSRYGGGSGSLAPCSDDDSIKDQAYDYNDERDLRTPPGTDYNVLIGKIGDIWRSWGWRVEEREGFTKPNQFGYAPDGFWLSVESAGDYYPSFGGSSPCFKIASKEDREQDITSPTVITRDQPDGDQPHKVFNW